MTFRLIGRFLRSWLKRPFAIPLGAIALVLTVVFIVLTRVEISPEGDRALNYGGRDISISLNQGVDLQSGSVDLRKIEQELQALGARNQCFRIGSYIGNYSYFETTADCGGVAFGDVLVEGRSTAAVNEVVVAGSTKLKIGDTISGHTPQPLTVVGITNNKFAENAPRVLAHTGTWLSWPWPATTSTHPRLGGIAMMMVDAPDVPGFEDQFAVAQSGSPLLQDALLSNALTSRSTNVDRQNWLYKDIAIPAMIFIAFLGMSLNRRIRTSRTELLVTQGLSPNKAGRVVAQAELVTFLLYAGAGITVGFGMSLALSPLLAEFLGRPLSGVPPLWDPVLRILGGVFLAHILVITNSWFTNLRRKRGAQKMASVKPKAFKFRAILSALFVGIAVSLFVTQFTFDRILITGIIICAAVALIAPELILVAVRFIPAKNPSSKYAAARVRKHIGSPTLVFTGALLTAGPLLLISTFIASTVEMNNEMDRQPPISGQAIFYQVDQAKIGNDVSRIISSVIPESRAIEIGSLDLGERDSITASPEGTGGVRVIKSVEDLEAILQKPVSAEIRKVLEGGGVLFGNDSFGNPYPKDANSLWLTSGSSQPKPVPLPSAIQATLEWRWSKAAPAIILGKSAEKLGIKVAPTFRVFTNVPDDQRDAVKSALVSEGYDQRTVEMYREGDRHSIGALDYVLIFLVVFISLAMVLGAINGSLKTLGEQSVELNLLGVSVGWLKAVFAKETLSLVALGTLAGVLISVPVAGLSIAQQKVGFVVPWGLLAIILAMEIVLVIAMVVIQGRRYLQPAATGR